MKDDEPDSAMSEKGIRERSPSYPFISLGAAIERLKAFETYFGRHPGSAEKAGPAWDMKPGSSQASQTIAAMKSFGLVVYEGAGLSRKVLISADARTYLRAQQDGIKQVLLRRMALAPKAIGERWQEWGADRPPNAICLDQLVLELKFTQSAADTFLKVYDDTIAFAGLSSPDKIISEDSEQEDGITEGGQTMQPNMSGGAAKRIIRPHPMRETLVATIEPNAVESAPLRVSFDGRIVEVSARLSSAEAVEQLIRVLQANKPLLPDTMESTGAQDQESQGS